MNIRQLSLIGMLGSWLLFSSVGLPFLELVIVAIYFTKVPVQIRRRF